MAHSAAIHDECRILLESGYNNKEAAAHLDISPSTVREWVAKFGWKKPQLSRLPSRTVSLLKTALTSTRNFSKSARIARVTNTTAARWARRLEIRPKRMESAKMALIMFGYGASAAKVAEAVGISPIRARQIRASVPALRTHKEINLPPERLALEPLICEMRRTQRASIPELKAAFGWSHGAIQRCLERNGLNRLP